MNLARQNEADGQAAWEAAVAHFLRAHPGFLAAHPELYDVLAPPRRPHGEVAADHMQAMLTRARAQAAGMSAQVAAGRACDQLLGRVHAAVLALMACTDVADYVAEELPACLGMDLARPLPAAEAEPLAALLGRRAVLLRERPADAAALYGEAAALACHDALVCLPSWGVLCLASRHPIGAEAAQASLPFLGRAVAAALAR